MELLQKLPILMREASLFVNDPYILFSKYPLNRSLVTTDVRDVNKSKGKNEKQNKKTLLNKIPPNKGISKI